ncbi:hypothetical protein GQ53DRAFT_775301 [Thozetella sp. PMI_491]|nr:hypothetical protein GQ53DRAFT_775301 [Thozetella sp. PMI_491]
MPDGTGPARADRFGCQAYSIVYLSASIGKENCETTYLSLLIVEPTARSRLLQAGLSSSYYSAERAITVGATKEAHIAAGRRAFPTGPMWFDTSRSQRDERSISRFSMFSKLHICGAHNQSAMVAHDMHLPPSRSSMFCSQTFPPPLGVNCATQSIPMQK